MLSQERINLASHFGIAVKSYEDSIKWIYYDGDTIHLSSRCVNEDIEHEIGHFLAATVKERKLPDYGLGRGPMHPGQARVARFNLVTEDRILKYEEKQAQEPTSEFQARRLRESNKESAASLFGIAVTYRFGKKDEWRNHAEGHNWDRSEHACDLFCLIRSTEHYHLKSRLEKVIKTLDAIQLEG